MTSGPVTIGAKSNCLGAHVPCVNRYYPLGADQLQQALAASVAVFKPVVESSVDAALMKGCSPAGVFLAHCEATNNVICRIGDLI